MNLPHVVDLYAHAKALNASTGAAIIGTGTEYPAPFTTAVRAFVQSQPGGSTPDYLAGTTTWHVYFGADPGLLPNGLIVWTDNGNVARYLVVVLVRDMAGQGKAWRAECYERLAG